MPGCMIVWLEPVPRSPAGPVRCKQNQGYLTLAGLNHGRQQFRDRGA